MEQKLNCNHRSEDKNQKIQRVDNASGKFIMNITKSKQQGQTQCIEFCLKRMSKSKTISERSNYYLVEKKKEEDIFQR